MINGLQLSASIISSSIILIAMGCVSAIFSVVMLHKIRRLEKISKNLSVTVFNKTFNIFDPFPEQRKTIQRHIELVILLVVYSCFFGFSIVLLKILEMGVILGFVTFIVCLGLLMIDETLEFHKNATLFINALRNGTRLGNGDIDALLVMESVLPRLSGYHLSLAVLFFAGAAVVPFVLNAFLLTFSQFGPMVTGITTTFSFAPPIGFLVITLLFASIAVLMQFASDAVKNRIFSFPPRERIDSMSEPFFRMKMFVRIMHHHPKLPLPEPEQPRKAEEKTDSNG